MSATWYYELVGEEFGPVPSETIEQMASDGLLGSDDRVRDATTGRWSTVAFASLSDNSNTAVATLAPATPPSHQWFYRVFGIELGPVELEDLLHLIANGELSPDDEVRLESSSLWRQLRSVGRLAAALPFEHCVKTIESTNIRQTTLDAIHAAAQRDRLDHIVATSPASSPIAAGVITSHLQNLSEPSWLSAPFQPATATEISGMWFGKVNGVEYGPVCLSEISVWLTTGQLSADDYVREEHDDVWVCASSLPRIVPDAPLPATSAVPPETLRGAIDQSLTDESANVVDPNLKLPAPEECQTPVPFGQSPVKTPAATTNPMRKPLSTATKGVAGDAPSAATAKPAPNWDVNAEVDTEIIVRSRTATQLSKKGYQSSEDFGEEAPKTTGPVATAPRHSKSPGRSATRTSVDRSRWIRNLTIPVTIVAVVTVGAAGYCGLMPEDLSGDIATYKQLVKTLEKVRELRSGPAADWQSDGEKLIAESKSIVKQYRPVANAKRQNKVLLFHAAKSIESIFSEPKPAFTDAEQKMESLLGRFAKLYSQTPPAAAPEPAPTTKKRGR